MHTPETAYLRHACRYLSLNLQYKYMKDMLFLLTEQTCLASDEQTIFIYGTIHQVMVQSVSDNLDQSQDLTIPLLIPKDYFTYLSIIFIFLPIEVTEKPPKPG